MTPILLAALLLAQEADTAIEPAAEPAAEPIVSQVALDLIEQIPATLEGWAPDGMEGAMVMQLFAIVGREDLIARFDKTAFVYGPCPLLEGDALETVISAAREAQIVIVNEAHNQPFHRHVIEQLGLALSNEFDVFAAETFNYVRLMEPRGDGALGWYDREPVFARQLAALDEAGYRFVAYEIRAHQRDPEATGRSEQIAVREEAQADNLIAEVLQGDPEARILVHVGYSHVVEAPQPQGEGEDPLVWFAARLKAKTGIDPLTISQTHCSPEGSFGRQDGAPAGDGADAPPLEPAGLALADGADRLPEGSVDLFLARRPMTFTGSRPDWRRSIGDVAAAIPEALTPTDRPVIIEARAPEMSLEHLPIDRVLVYPGEAPVLLLPEGDWIVTAWDANGQVGEAVTVTAQ